MRRYNDYKFRAWTSKKKQMEYFDFDGCGSWLDHEQYTDTAPDSIMQYIGLTDRNNKDIYEGDLVRIVDYFCNPKDEVEMHRNYLNKIGAIEYYHARFHIYNDEDSRNVIMINTIKDHNVGGNLSDDEIDSDYLEVIGNIYENPDLIK